MYIGRDKAPGTQKRLDFAVPGIDDDVGNAEHEAKHVGVETVGHNNPCGAEQPSAESDPLGRCASLHGRNCACGGGSERRVAAHRALEERLRRQF